ncbi:fluoride efflux transporter CrcB [Sediminibacillus albus]|uniref:Fluoride-specific ion channel FluC n=1 Tax=Sediminibacillus albus TaxID=407036 RepID=A0A1G8YUZ5_9BACI|nr:fluoride efflux transporter CrcB [Sediminibacillus albus]SDK06638.1 CrcB protein [Sediminibacillus albus]
MNLIDFLLVGTGGFFGAISRFAFGQYIGRRHSPAFPIATLIVNVLGSFLLGLLTGLETGQYLLLLIGTGFSGALTTFSTFKLESVQLHLNKRKKMFIVYHALSYAGGISLAFIGFQLGSLFSGM